MVSIIVPTYNVEQFIEEAIDSVIGQSYKDIEIILIDDGSTDSSGKICDAYQNKDSRIKVIHQENQGLSAARNTGLDICTGDVIAFLDPDDAFAKDAILKMLEAMQETGADIVECNFSFYKGNKHMDERKLASIQKVIAPKETRTGLYSRQEAYQLQLNGKIANNAWNKLYKRHVWDSLRYREGQNYEDIDIILPLLGEAENIYILDEKLVMHRRRKGSITSTRSIKNTKDYELAFTHYWEYVDEHILPNCNAEERQSILENKLYRLFDLLFSYEGCTMAGKDEYYGFIREQIQDVKPKIDINSCKREIRVANYLYMHFPLFISIIVYNFSRLISKIFNKLRK